MKPAYKILKDAVGVIEKYGWQQWNNGVVGGPACAMGALNEAAQPGTRHGAWSAGFYDATKKLSKVINAIAWNQSITAWNDTPGRTKSEVITALKKAMRLAR